MLTRWSMPCGRLPRRQRRTRPCPRWSSRLVGSVREPAAGQRGQPRKRGGHTPAGGTALFRGEDHGGQPADLEARVKLIREPADFLAPAQGRMRSAGWGVTAS